MADARSTLPDFLGIGAQRCGTTWLDAQLRRHPAIYLPRDRKELHFFDTHYSKGLDWYRGFFQDAGPQARIGEITPRYLYSPLAADRIARHLPKARLIAILRNPADRAYSQYGLLISQGMRAASFEAVIEAHPDLYYRGLYASQISRFTCAFPREQLLILIFEELMKAPLAGLAEVCRFLELDEHGLSVEGVGRPVGGSRSSRFAWLRRATHHVSKRLRAADLDWMVNTAKTARLRRMFDGGRQALPPLLPETRQALLRSYKDDIQRLERLLDRSLDIWRN